MFFCGVKRFKMRWTVLTFAVLLSAQARPDFTGHWELIRSGDGPDGSPIAIDVIESGKSPRVLSVTRHFASGGAEAREYPFGVSGRVGGISVGGGIQKTLSIDRKSVV